MWYHVTILCIITVAPHLRRNCTHYSIFSHLSFSTQSESRNLSMHLLENVTVILLYFVFLIESTSLHLPTREKKSLWNSPKTHCEPANHSPRLMSFPGCRPWPDVVDVLSAGSCGFRTSERERSRRDERQCETLAKLYLCWLFLTTIIISETGERRFK